MLDIGGFFSFREISSTGSTNLIANAGFDNVSDSVPLNWALVNVVGTVVYDDVEGHDSPGSVRIEVSGTDDMRSSFPKSELIDAEPGTTYTFSAWGKCSGVDGSHAPAVRVVELDGSGGRITQHNLDFGRDSDWEEKKTSFTTSSDVSKLYVYANIWESYGTFWVDDVTLETCGTGNIQLVSAFEKNYDGSITQHVTSSDIAFRFDYIPRDRYIEVHGDVQDLRGVDRSIQVQYVLPVDATGWQWGDYIRKIREIESGVRYENVYRIGEVRTQNAYPFTFVGEDEQGLSLAVPMDVPRIYRIGYDTNAGGYSIEYDFGLANCTDKIGAGHANFTFIVYKVDEPEWRFRAAAKKYYELYPEFFVKRNEMEGIWFVGGNPLDIPNVNDFGIAFDDSHYYSVLRRVFDHQHGIYPMQYTEPRGWWRDFGDNSTEPSYDEKIAVLIDDYENGSGTWRDVVTTKFAAEAVLNSAPYDENGNQHLNISYFWNNWGSWSQNYPTNLDPDIPSPNRYDISYVKYLQSNTSGDYAYNWTFESNCSLDTNAHSGNYSIKIEIPGTSDIISESVITDHIPATLLAEYNFTAWGKTLNCDGTYSPCVRVAEYDSNGTWITQQNLDFGFGTTDWTEKTTTFTTTADTAYIQVYGNFWMGYGTFWFDDVELYESGGDINLVENHGFESTYNWSDYPCSGYRIDSISTSNDWAKIENYRRSHWNYADHPLIFSYDTKQPVLLGTLSQYDCFSYIHENMTGTSKRVDANIYPYSYSFYGHLIDVFGSEITKLQMDDDDASLRRTMSYQKTNRNLLNWVSNGDDSITHDEMKNYMNDQMFYGMFPSIMTAAPEETYGSDMYWKNATLYERDRNLFKQYIPIIKEISAAGWDPIPYATCDSPDIKFERYGGLGEGLYFTVASRSSMTESGVLSVDSSKFGFDGTTVEVKELLTNMTSVQNVEGGKVLIAITELHPNETLVYKISS
ncbi:MAG: carbohydrate binding domain-containing protein [Methanosarcinales archaeon]